MYFVFSRSYARSAISGKNRPLFKNIPQNVQGRQPSTNPGGVTLRTVATAALTPVAWVGKPEPQRPFTTNHQPIIYCTSTLIMVNFALADVVLSPRKIKLGIV
jgi:hypothetical protein